MAEATTTRPAAGGIETADVLAVDAAVARSTGSDQFGVTAAGFVPKSFARLLAEKLALARTLLGDDLDLGSGSAVRKLLEISALEDARTWAALAAVYDNSFVTSATGEALGRLGDELGLSRPFLEARGTVRVRLQGLLPPGHAPLSIPRGSRLFSPGGHHAATSDALVFSDVTRVQDVAVEAFYPGPAHNLDPTTPAADATFPQKLSDWNRQDDKLRDLVAAEQAAVDAGNPITLAIEHTAPLTGGQLRWPDERYRRLLLGAPRSVWTTEAIQVAVSLVPGVRQVQVSDGLGGLDIRQSIFGNFNFIERVFQTERDLASPYYFTVLVAPTPSAIWGGPDGLEASVLSAIEDLRPIGIFPQVREAAEVAIGVQADLLVRGYPLPSGSSATINASPPAAALKARLRERVRRHIENLPFGEPVRASEVTWAIMNEPGVIDVRDLRLLRFPARLQSLDFASPVAADPEVLECGANAAIQADQIPVFVDDDSKLRIV